MDESVLMVRIPALIPLEVEVPHVGQELILYRERRDFGITAAVIAASALSATAATVARITVSQSAATAETVNTLAARVTQALETQNTINSHIQLGMLNLNQQTAYYGNRLICCGWCNKPLVLIFIILPV